MAIIKYSSIQLWKEIILPTYTSVDENQKQNTSKKSKLQKKRA